MNAPSREAVARLAHRKTCPRCDLDKTWGAALCRRCRNLLPHNMRRGLVEIPKEEPGVVVRALRAAASYFNQHFQSVRKFGGGRRR